MKFLQVAFVATLLIAAAVGRVHNFDGHKLHHKLTKAQSWVIGDKNYTVLNNIEKSWVEKAAECHAEGMELATPRSLDDQRNIEIVILNAKFDSEYIWTSGINLDNSWVWLTQNWHVLSYVNWAAGNPSDPVHPQSCIAIAGVGTGFTWHNFDCWAKHNAVCEL